METKYTDERNAQILISLLKAHGIRKVIASPGSTNVCFVASIQQDPFFEIYSAPDERSAGYIACGMAAENCEPVILSCTGATASRNYMPALTEAYYRKLPVLVVTSSRRSYLMGHNIAQITDRTQLPSDIAKLSVQMPLVFDDEAAWYCSIQANKAILELNHRGTGPVHINLETNYSFNFHVQQLPEARVIRRFVSGEQLPEINAERIAIMVGAHLRWSKGLTDAVDEFCKRHNAVVLCDHTSNYKGQYRVLANLASVQENYTAVFKNVDVLIHIGDISASEYRINAKEVWRVNPDGEIRDTYKNLCYVFEMEETAFFSYYGNCECVKNTFWQECRAEKEKLESALTATLEDFSFSNIWTASQLAGRIPCNAVMHFGIFNSLRSWNFFEIPAEVNGYSNTGGFGIDGCVSSAIGAALANPNKIIFCVVGDLAFFYDMNSVGNRHVPSNLRILLINNGIGAEFKLAGNNGTLFGECTNTYIAAAGHYGSKSANLVRHYAEDLGFEYLTASSKETFSKAAERFVTPELQNKPMFFEVFTTDTAEVEAQKLMMNIYIDDKSAAKKKAQNAVKSLLGEKGVTVVKKLLGK